VAVGRHRPSADALCVVPPPTLIRLFALKWGASGSGGSTARGRGPAIFVACDNYEEHRDPCWGDGTGLAEALLGLDGFGVLAVTETPAEVVIEIETTAVVVGCPGCGVRAAAQDRMRVDIRDLPCFGRPARLVWRKRRWRCREELCSSRTWTETSEHVSTRAVLTRPSRGRGVPAGGRERPAGVAARGRAGGVLVDGS